MADTSYENRTKEITIKRHMEDGWKEMTAVGTAEVSTSPDGVETIGQVAYSVPDNDGIKLTDEEKDALNRELGIGSGATWEDTSETDEEISEEDFEDANPDEDELEDELTTDPDSEEGEHTAEEPEDQPDKPKKSRR
jgi:hypothetical protein